MAELVDARDLKSLGRKAVPVRARLRRSLGIRLGVLRAEKVPQVLKHLDIAGHLGATVDRIERPLGEIFDVAVDIRPGSPTFGQWHGLLLSSENKRQFYVPPGFAHGFAVVSETALFQYKCTEFYEPKSEASILWNDPALGIDWPVTAPELSAKDAAAVQAFFRAALAVGAEPLHEPRLWPEYHPDYYGAFVRDPDGNNVEAVCHQPE